MTTPEESMTCTTVSTQDEMDAALREHPSGCIHITSPQGLWLTVEASGSATVRASGSATVRAYDSATVRAYDSATVRAYGSATVRASGSATVRAYGSATVEAYDSATVRAYGSATVRASKYVAVHLLSASVTYAGGVVIDATRRDSTGHSWCEYHGATVTDGTAVLYKAVLDDYTTGRGGEWTYAPGRTVVARDFTAVRECGEGLHLCATPWQSRKYLKSATRYVAVRVDVASIIPLDDKCKVPSCEVLHEVDVDGEQIGSSR